MGKTVYTVVGQTNIRPEGLPEGLSVEVTTSTFRKDLPGFLVEDSTLKPGKLFVYQEVTGTDRHMSRTDVTTLRDALSEWLDETKTVLRVVHDANDSERSNWRWYEVEPDKFIYYFSEFDARGEVMSGGVVGREGLSYNEVENDYGIRTVTTWEV